MLEIGVHNIGVFHDIIKFSPNKFFSEKLTFRTLTWTLFLLSLWESLFLWIFCRSRTKSLTKMKNKTFWGLYSYSLWRFILFTALFYVLLSKWKLLLKSKWSSKRPENLNLRLNPPDTVKTYFWVLVKRWYFLKLQ